MSATAISDGRLRELLERVKAATGPDREIDASLSKHLLGMQIKREPNNRTWRHGQREPSHSWDALPAYTASIDAALALALRIVPDANCRGYEKGEWGVDAYVSRNNEPDGHWFVEARGETVPIAFIAAALNRLTALTQEHSDHVHP